MTRTRKKSPIDHRLPIERLEGWFAERGWTPFAFQRETWNAYLAGESGLLHAATGTGKTYAAFLGPILEALAEPPSEGLRILWLTPLRALAADTTAGLQAAVAGIGLDWRVESRTGDTSAAARARQKKRLPEVLVTTPESLTLFLSYAETSERFSNLRTVIVDEWHELLASKRGVQTELALARLRTWNPRLRLWGVSATLGNLTEARDTLLGVGQSGRIVQGALPKRTMIDSIIPASIERFPWAGHLGLSLLPRVLEAIEEGNTALVFTNTRAQTETWYQAILAGRPEWAGQIALHHGSLDRKTRDWVEDQLRMGTLRCVVCTSSLDLGVDFSPVDRVIQIGSPKGVARLLQRAGRSGHQPGGVSRVTCVPTNTIELLEVAAARHAAESGRIEARPAMRLPLDVLAQHVVTIASAGGFRACELYDEVRTTHSFANLTPLEWNWTLDFVRRGGETLRAYPEYRRVNEIDGLEIIADERTAKRHRMSIGTIVGEAMMEVRFLRGGRLGSVEEAFVARLKAGDQFIFAGRTLEFVRVHEMTVWVRKSRKVSRTVPRWMGGRMPLSSELAGAVREQLRLARENDWSAPERAAVRPILDLQATYSHIPAPDELLIERMVSREGHHLFIHPFEGRLVHEGLSALLAYRLARIQPLTFSIAVNDYGFELLSAEPTPWNENVFSAGLLGADILSTVNASEMARRHFREIARIAGLVFPGYPGGGKSAKQMQASSGLLYDVFREYDPEHLLLKQAKREVLERQFEEGRLRAALERLARAKIVWIELRRPSPFAFPLMVERLRESLTSEKLADRVKRMTAEWDRA